MRGDTQASCSCGRAEPPHGSTRLRGLRLTAPGCTPEAESHLRDGRPTVKTHGCVYLIRIASEGVFSAPEQRFSK